MSGRDDSGLLDDAPLGNRVVPPCQPFLPVVGPLTGSTVVKSERRAAGPCCYDWSVTTI
jgi:hypothetical protein